MTYATGYRISLSSLNQFYAAVGAVYGTGMGDMGYGQSALSFAPIAPTAPVGSSHFSNLINLITVCANHQGVTPNPNLGITPSPETAITASSVIADAVQGLFADRLSVAATTTAQNVLTTSASANWSGTISASFTASFATEDAARYFFNTGGALKIRLSHPNGGTGPDTEWRYALATDIGTISFGPHQTAISGALVPTVTNVGYYQLGDTDYELLGLVGVGNDAPYSNDVLTVSVAAHRLGYAGTNNANGSGIAFTISLTDTGSAFGLAAGTTLAVDVVKCADFTNIASPTLALTSAF